MESDKEKMAIKIQRNIRRQLQGLHQLKQDSLCDYTPFLIGNDLPLTRQDLADYVIDRNFLLVGTSVFRSVDLGCKLAKSETVFPKIIIIDNSKDVLFAWENLKFFFGNSELTDADEFVNDDTDGLLEYILKNMHETVRGANVVNYFKNFFKQHSLDYVKKIVMATSVIAQDWGDVDTFMKIRKIYAGRPIVAYSSNIVQFVSPEVQVKVLASIDALKPSCSICSDLHPVKKRPTRSYLIRDSSPMNIATELNLCDAVKEAYRIKDEPDRTSRSIDTLK